MMPDLFCCPTDTQRRRLSRWRGQELFTICATIAETAVKNEVFQRCVSELLNAALSQFAGVEQLIQFVGA